MSTQFTKFVKKYLGQCQQFLLPRVCFFCQQKTFNKIDLCEYCQLKLPFNNAYCRYCATQLINKAQAICADCLVNQKLRLFDETVLAFDYTKPIPQLITQLKFDNHLLIAKLLGNLLSMKIQQKQLSLLPECIIPVPLSTKRLKIRGYNQALEIARPIAKQLKIPINTNLIIKIKDNQAQTLLSAQERINNVENVYQIKRFIPYRHIVLVDDVMTTGNTLRAITKLLRHAGIQKISAWVCAKA